MRTRSLIHSPVLASLTIGCVLALATGSVAAQAGHVTSIELPPDRVELKPGPGLDTARANCITCHSAQYIYMQPPLTREQWQAEVAKMRKAYGAPIPESQDKTIVDYLVSQNGKAPAPAESADKVKRPR